MTKRARFVRAIGVAILAALIALLLPHSTSAEEEAGFSISPPEIRVGGIFPGQSAEFSLIIRNDMASRVSFSISVYNPDEDERRGGYDALPDNSWISFDAGGIEVAPHSSGWVKARVTIPPDESYGGKNYECWVRVTSGKVGIFQYQLNSRVYIVTGVRFPPTTNWVLIGGSIAAVLIAVGLIWNERRRIKSWLGR